MADNIQATPRNYLGGLLTDAYKWMQSPERTQQMQGFAGLLGTTGVPQTIERMAYGEPLTNIGRANVPLLKPDTADALMTVGGFAPEIKAAAKMLPKNVPVGMSIKPVDDVVGLLTPARPIFDVSKRDASEIFGAGAERVMYKDPTSGGAMEVLAKPDGTASVLSLEVPEKFRGKGIGESLQAKVMQDFPSMMGQVSSKAAAKTAYRLGRRPPSMPDATLDDVYKLMDENSSVNLVSPEMQKTFMPAQPSFTYPQEEAMRLAQQRAALPVEQGGLGLLSNNTPAERAAAMGFDIESLHGTSNPNIQKFDPSLVGTKAGNAFDNYMWSTTSPDAATGYSLNMKSYEALPEVVNLREQKNDILKQISKAFEEKDSGKVGDLRKQLNSIADKESAIFDTFKQGQILSEGSTVYPLALQRQEFMPYDASGKSWMRANKPAIEQSQDLGYQGVQINNVIDNPNAFMGNTPATTFATENPDLLRSRFAAFDPWRRTAATAAAMGVAAPDLLAQEQQPYQGLLGR